MAARAIGGPDLSGPSSTLNDQAAASALEESDLAASIMTDASVPYASVQASRTAGVKAAPIQAGPPLLALAAAFVF